MPELVCSPPLHTLLPELTLKLNTIFENVECEMQPCPDLEKSPFNLGVSSLGQLIYIVPNSISSVEACRQIVGGKLISTTQNFHIVTDEKSSFVLKIQLQQHQDVPSCDWKHHLRHFFDQHLQSENWEVVCVVLESHKSGQASIHLIKECTEECPAPSAGPLKMSLWLTCVNRRIVAGTTKMMHSPNTSTTAPASSSAPATPTNGLNNTNGKVEVEKPKKKKIVKRLVVRNSSPSASPKEAPARVETKVEENGTAPFLYNSTLSRQEAEITAAAARTAEAVNGAHKSTTRAVHNPKGNSPGIHENNSNIPNGLPKKTDINGVNGIQPNAVNSENKILQRVNSEPNKRNGGGKVGKMAAIFNGRSQSQQQESAECVAASGAPVPSAIEQKVQQMSDEFSDKPSGLSSIPDFPSDTANSEQHSQHSKASAVQLRKNSSEDLVSDEDNLSYSSALNSSSFHLNSNSLAISIPANGGEQTSSSESTVAPTQTAICEPEVPSNGVTKGHLPNSRRTLTPPTCSTPASLLNGYHLSGRVLSPISSASSMPEPEEEDETLYQVLQDDCFQRPSVERDDSEMLDLSFRDDYSYCSNTTEMFDRTFMRRKESNNILSTTKMTPEVVVNGQKCGGSNSRNLLTQRQPSPLKEQQMVRGTEMPVVVLQHVLSRLSFNDLSELRRVHPHWDELCGQMLNSAYYQLIHTADRLLTDCQRRMHKEKHLVQCGQIMTKIQVHVLNPVDVLRAAMDEGVLCFPYGRLLDKTFDLLGRVERVIQGIDDPDTILNWERLAELSRRAQVHYRQFVEPEAEKRMAEVCKLSAVHRLQRLDSFLVEASVNKLEKVAEKAKDDVRFEIEQLKNANQQLKKDNRELKQTCLKLDARVEVLERKFKTMARLLQ